MHLNNFLQFVCINIIIFVVLIVELLRIHARTLFPRLLNIAWYNLKRNFKHFIATEFVMLKYNFPTGTTGFSSYDI